MLFRVDVFTESHKEIIRFLSFKNLPNTTTDPHMFSPNPVTSQINAMHATIASSDIELVNCKELEKWLNFQKMTKKDCTYSSAAVKCAKTCMINNIKVTMPVTLNHSVAPV